MKSKTSAKGFGKVTVDTSKKFDFYKVLEVDEKDNTVNVCNLSMALRTENKGLIPATNYRLQLKANVEDIPYVVGTTVWCKPKTPLKMGDIVRGTFSFDPKKSEKLKKLPTFTPIID